MKRMAMIAALMLSGCASTTSHFGTATMEADPSLLGLEGVGYQTQLAQAYTRAPPPVVEGQPPADSELCRQVLPGYQENGSQPYARHRRGRDPILQFQCLYLIQNPTGEQVSNHLEAGLALSDLYCDIYFRRISRRWNERVFLRNTTNDVGAAVSAVLGLTAAGSGVTGGIGAAFGLADALFRNYDDVFLVTPDLPTMQNLVRQYQRLMRVDAVTHPPTNYYQAQARILEYARLCSYVGMRSLLNGAIDRTVEQLRGNTPTLTPIDRNLENSPLRAAVINAATQAAQEQRAIEERRATELEAAVQARQRAEALQSQLESGQQNQVDPQANENGPGF